MTKEGLAAAIDHTILRLDAGETEVRRAIGYAGAIGAASVCLHPVYVKLAAGMLNGTGTKVCTVVGFPLGANTTGAKVAEAQDAWLMGAEELDMVIHVGAMKDKKHEAILRDIEAVVKATPALVKVILETGLLTAEETRQGCKLAEKAGAQFIKTSTGFGPRGASAKDVLLMKKSVSPAVRVKAAGGIATLAQALALLDAGADRLGLSRTASVLAELE